MYTFITNPNARSGLGGQVWHSIETVLNERNIPHKVLFTKFQCHATKLVRELTSDGQTHTIVVLGGDGTINEVVNGITDYTKVTLGYIPIGSSNDFARFFGLSRDPLQALDAILTPGKYAYMNVGLLSYRGHKKYFAVSAGLGFDAAICHQAVVSKFKILLNKIKLGSLIYVTIALDRLFYLVPRTMTVTLDGEKKLVFEKAYFATVMNHPYEGGGFKFCPKADPCDDTLDVIVIAGLSKIKTLLLLPAAFKGKHVKYKGVYTYTCKQVTIESEKPLPVHTDGEPIYLQNLIGASLQPDKLRVIIG